MKAAMSLGLMEWVILKTHMNSAIAKLGPESSRERYGSVGPRIRVHRLLTKLENKFERELDLPLWNGGSE
jgi:hypothetical protein